MLNFSNTAAGITDVRPHGEVGDVTRLLLQWKEGSDEALDRLTPMLYGELKRLARCYMQDERNEPLLQTTALVHEAYLRITGLDMDWEGRNHFVAVAATLMRRILVDFARRRKADKRGGGERPVSLEGEDFSDLEDGPEDTTLALHEALRSLETLDSRKHRAVEMKYFGGATVAEIAGVLELAPRTVERDLRLARAWLADALGANGAAKLPPS